VAKPQDIVARTFQFALRIIELANQLDDGRGSTRVLAKQILRSGTSIGANIEEAQAAESKADFTHKYNIALKEARETKYWLRLISASNGSINTDLDSLIKESDEICRIIAQIVINARREK
jgi:four helix bundle protein